ncbi:MAG: FtsX-like permease family protein [Pseudomonadales bacterium]|nr:FtsX-like permease family protein [Pseudomonadales bacterium]
MANTPLARLSAAYVMAGAAGETPIFATAFIDEFFFDCYEIPFVAGRGFSLERDQPAQLFLPELAEADLALRTVVINEAAVGHLGLASADEAIGKLLTYPSRFAGRNHVFEVIGVAQNTQFYSLRAAPRPELYFFQPQYSDVLVLRYQGNPQAVREQVAEVWRRVMGDAELSVSFLEQHIGLEFAQERKEGLLFVGFSLFTILIACLGLYGSSVLAVEKRTKEIGVRKVLGAEVREIVALLVWQFSKPVLLANAIAWPVALWAMLSWLQRFPYQIDLLLLIPLCVLAGTIALSIAWLTVGGTAAKAASQKPVLALRYE